MGHRACCASPGEVEPAEPPCLCLRGCGWARVTLGQCQGRVSGSCQVMRLAIDGVVLPPEKLEATQPIWGEIAELWVSLAGLAGGGLRTPPWLSLCEGPGAAVRDAFQWWDRCHRSNSSARVAFLGSLSPLSLFLSLVLPRHSSVCA